MVPVLAATILRGHRAVDRAAAECSGDPAEYRAERLVAMAGDAVTDQRAADAADDQTGRAIRVAAIRVAVSRVDARRIVPARFRRGRDGDRRNRDGDGAERQNELTHDVTPLPWIKRGRN